MKLGKDFWFWLRLLAEIIKAIFFVADKTDPNPPSPGQRMVEAALAVIAEDNEDDSHTRADFKKL